MLLSVFKKICLSVAAFATIVSCVLPCKTIEARGEGAVAAAAGVGALVGAAIASDIQHRNNQRRCYRAQCYRAQQQQIMNYVLVNYNPAFHDAWVRYIIVDCSSILSPEQQNQMLNVINQKRNELGRPLPVRGAVEVQEIYVQPEKRV